MLPGTAVLLAMGVSQVTLGSGCSVDNDSGDI